jgi:transcriptional regulator with XRE-family HTH domain
MQNKEVKVDLRVSRRESGLLQSDLAKLLETTQPRISRLEQGKSVLTVSETVKLAIIFNKNTTALFRLLSARLREELAAQIDSIPTDVAHAPDAQTREATLSRLSAQLLANRTNAYADAQ